MEYIRGWDEARRRTVDGARAVVWSAPLDQTTRFFVASRWDAYASSHPTSSQHHLGPRVVFLGDFLSPTTPAHHQRLRMAISPGELQAGGLWAFRPASWPRQTHETRIPLVYMVASRGRRRPYLIQHSRSRIEVVVSLSEEPASG